MDDTYCTIRGEAREEFAEKRSRFIGSAKPVVSEGEAAEFIRGVRARNREASHNVYAYVLRAGQARRYSDDGEPQGTAGVPVLEVLLKGGIADAAVVVTRYFGGVLLGAGGLVRAYSRAASLAVEAAGRTVMAACLTASLRCPYDRYGRVAPLVERFGGAVDGETFAEQVTLSFHLPCGGVAAFRSALADATGGGVRLEPEGKKYYPSA
mgnify:CR=1 FL=1